MKGWTLSTFVLATIAGCGGSEAPAPPAEDFQDLTTLDYTVSPGQERYLCYTFRSPAEQKAITRVEPIQGQVVHHVALFRTTSEEPEGFFECPEIIRLNWQPVWAGGAGADPLTLPDDVGFVVEPETQYLVQYHVQNTRAADVTERSTIRLTYGSDPAAVQPAGIFALGALSLTIPPATAGFEQVVECSADRELNVFAVFPHMHKLGKSVRLDVGKTAADAEVAYAKEPWVFGEQPMEPVDLAVSDGDFLRSTCRWDNPGATEVTFGESSEDEMCITVLFYYPFTGLAGCIGL